MRRKGSLLLIFGPKKTLGSPRLELTTHRVTKRPRPPPCSNCLSKLLRRFCFLAQSIFSIGNLTNNNSLVIKHKFQQSFIAWYIKTFFNVCISLEQSFSILLWALLQSCRCFWYQRKKNLTGFWCNKKFNLGFRLKQISSLQLLRNTRVN